MTVKQRLRQVERILRNRELIYVGPRGADALPLAVFGNLGAVFSLIAPAGSGVSDTCMEAISGVRVDLNSYSLDEDHSEHAALFCATLFARLSRLSALVYYSPSPGLTRSLLLARDTVLPLGLFYEQQTCFDYKPWVERELERCGISTLPWEYVRALESPRVTDLVDQGTPIVVRWPRSRGGYGIWLIRDRGDLDSVMEPPSGAGFFCVAPYFEVAVSVNVNACVFAEGEVSIHGSSVQLVGIEVCTSRQLGYTGNDFASISDLPVKALKGLDAMTRSLGGWLACHGYRGAFGFDALVIGDRVLFVELNPRFQASSAVAARLDRTIGRSDQYVDHIAAFLGLMAADRLSLPELVKEQEPLSHIVVYNGRSVALQRTPGLEGLGLGARLLPTSGVVVEPQAILASILWGGRVTETGRELREEASTAVLNLLKSFVPASSAG